MLLLVAVGVEVEKHAQWMVLKRSSISYKTVHARLEVNLWHYKKNT